MVFVLDTAIGLGVWLPFTIGKSAALLSVSGSTAIVWSMSQAFFFLSWILIVFFKFFIYPYEQ